MGQAIDKLRILRVMIRDVFQSWRKDVWPHDLDAPYCCDGRECGCGASTWRDIYLWSPEP